MFAVVPWFVFVVGLAPEASTLSWRAPEGCPTETELNDRLRGDIERARVVERFAFEVWEDDGRWFARTRGDAPRDLEADSCAALADAAVVMVRLALAEPEAKKAPLATWDDPVPPPDPTLTTTTPDPSPAPRLDFSLGARAGATVFATPHAAAELEVVAGLRGHGWSVDLGALGRPWFSGADTGQPDVTSRFSTWAALVRGCGVPGAGRVEVPLCAGIEAGTIVGRASGVENPKIGRGPWLAGRVDVQVRVRAGRRVFPYVQAGVIAPIARPRFNIDGAGQVCCSDAVGLTASAGVEFRLRPAWGDVSGQ